MKAFFQFSAAALALVILFSAAESKASAANHFRRVCCDALEVNPEPVRCARAWLQMMDVGDYGQTWQASSQLLQCKDPLSSWEKMLRMKRRPYGRVISREYLFSRYFTELAGYPCGEYSSVEYKTEFQKVDQPLREYLVLHKECDCVGSERWKVMCYRTCPACP